MLLAKTAKSACPLGEDVRLRHGVYLAAGYASFGRQIKTLAEGFSMVPSCYRHIMPGGHKCLGTSVKDPSEVTDDARSTCGLQVQC